MLGVHIVDIIVVIVYFAAMIYIGYLAMRKIKGQEDFFLGGRSFGKFLQTFSMFGQATSAESAVTASSVVGQKGLAGVFFSVFNGLLTLPVFWFIPLWARRIRIMSMGDFFAERFRCRKLAALYAIAQAALFIMVGGMGLYAMSKTVAAIAEKPEIALSQTEQAELAQARRLKALENKPLETMSRGELDELDALQHLENPPRERFSYVNTTALIIGMAVFVFVYAAGGGLRAAVWTDAIQSIFILILTALLIPFAMVRINALCGTAGLVGPFQAVHRTLPAYMLELFGSPMLAGFTWHYILLLSLIGVAGGFAYANNLVVFGAAKTEKAARYGCMNGLVLKRACTVIWAILALLILVLYGTQTKDADLLWGIATKNLLPVGLTGLMIACLMAALMSTADMHMLVVAGLLTQNIYKPIVGDAKGEAHYLKAGRLFGIVYIGGAVLVAVNASNLFEMFKYMFMLNVTMGPCILMAYLWRRTNVAGAWASMGVSLLLTLFIPLAVSWTPAVQKIPALHAEIGTPPIEREYSAKVNDVKERADQVAAWDAREALGQAEGTRPSELVEGQAFTKTFPGKKIAVFWAGGIKTNENGDTVGTGLFRTELYLLHLFGVDLVSNSVAVNESLSLLFKLVFPFAAVLLMGFLTKPVDDKTLDRFYGRLLTPVKPDHEEDAREVELTYQNPHRFNDTRLLPNSNWYFRRWTRTDWMGLLYAVSAMIIIGALMVFFAGLGA